MSCSVSVDLLLVFSGFHATIKHFSLCKLPHFVGFVFCKVTLKFRIPLALLLICEKEFL